MMGKDMRPYFIDMLKALHYCHSVANVIHRDIKPDNIMLNHNNEAVLIDFGVSALAEDFHISSNIGSYLFFAPEMFEGEKGTGEKSDIWALGVTFYFLLTGGTYPWKGAKNPMYLKEMV
jgi:serine/threonine protein kinase